MYKQMGMLTDIYGAISFTVEGGIHLEATPLHISKHQVTFEVVAPELTLRTSEVLNDFTLRLSEKSEYTGRATITSLSQSSTQAICVASIEDGWTGMGSSPWKFDPGLGSEAFGEFMRHWQKHYHIEPEFKVLVADMQTWLTDFRFWCGMTEAEAQSQLKSGDDWNARQLDMAHELGNSTTHILNEFFERFEYLSARSDDANRPAYRTLARRSLHPMLLCAPFLYRTYRKPLGYAGDYEMVNMISRNPFEGASLYAKLINLWFLKQPPAEAHRNRLQFLQEKIDEAVIRALAEGRRARIFNLGCGPAVELQEYLRKNIHSNHTDITLVDFNEETLAYAESRLEGIQRANQRSAKLTFIKKSVNQVLKDASRHSNDPEQGDQYDFVYCAGLYDYLTDAVCRRLSNQLYQQVRPDGLLVTTNVDASNPWSAVMDFIMDWHLIYRTGSTLLSTRPDSTKVEDCKVTSDYSGVNIYFETRKPDVSRI